MNILSPAVRSIAQGSSRNTVWSALWLKRSRGRGIHCHRRLHYSNQFNRKDGTYRHGSSNNINGGSRLPGRFGLSQRKRNSQWNSRFSSQATAVEANVTSHRPDKQDMLSWQAIRALFVASAVPMVGFGFMDNLVMIQAGQYIDSTLGVKFGLATMTAAAAGQVVSDVSGVLFGGTLETFINRWMPNKVAASLSMAQRQSTWGRYASLAGAVIGVSCGCGLGALTLFFVDLDARDRIQRAEQFKEVLSDMTRASKSGVSFPCREVIVHLAVQAHQHYDWKSLNEESDEGKEVNRPRMRMRSLDLQHVEEATEANKSWVVKAAHQQNVLANGQRLYAPIMRWEESKDDQIWAVVEFEKDGKDVCDTDIKKVELMASHLAIFLHRMSSD